jgi:hypothetical protein
MVVEPAINGLPNHQGTVSLCPYYISMHLLHFNASTAPARHAAPRYRITITHRCDSNNCTGRFRTCPYMLYAAIPHIPLPSHTNCTLRRDGACRALTLLLHPIERHNRNTTRGTRLPMPLRYQRRSACTRCITTTLNDYYSTSRSVAQAKPRSCRGQTDRRRLTHTSTELSSRQALQPIVYSKIENFASSSTIITINTFFFGAGIPLLL